MYASWRAIRSCVVSYWYVYHAEAEGERVSVGTADIKIFKRSGLWKRALCLQELLRKLSSNGLVVGS